MSLDFFEIKKKNVKNQSFLYPSFNYNKPRDLMVKGKAFYAVWDEDRKVWSTDEFDVQRLVDDAILKTIDKEPVDKSDALLLRDSSSNQWKAYKAYIKDMPDNYKQLDTKITFVNDICKKTDYVSKRLSYALEEGDISAYDELMSVLYSPEERQKLEWAIGAIVSGDSKKIQKFIAIFGKPGKGKGTFLNIVDSLFEGYVSSFNAKELANGNNSFAGDAFADNPLVAIQTDGNLSKIYDNTLLNSIVSHEKIIINEKFKSKYELRPNAFLFMATNDEVYITNYSSGLTRRLIDVYPTDITIPKAKYNELMSAIETEKGAIAYHCLQVYNSLGMDYYDKLKPNRQMAMSNPIYNFISMELMMEPVLMNYDYITLKKAYKMYLDYCDENRIKNPVSNYKLRDELKNYFDSYDDSYVTLPNGKGERNVFIGLHRNEFDYKFVGVPKPNVNKLPKWLDLKEQHSNLDDLMADFPAQYTRVDAKSGNRVPKVKWDKVTTKLKDLDTSEYHFINCPIEHIVIDFDIKGPDGEKNTEMNLEAAKELPPTYAELSQGGAGLHLHYIYDGDPNELARVYDDNVEIKVYSGDQAIRRRLTKCNNLKIAHISAGDLPVRETKKVLDFEGYKNEKALRTAIDNNLQKKNVPGTKPSVEFILKDLDRAYESGMHYDVTDLRPEIMAFAANSTHQSELCLEMVGKMKFRSEDCVDDTVVPEYDELPIIFFDVEVFPNLFVLVYKLQGKENKCVQMINPYREMVEELIHKYRLVGFNNRKYDNHILYAWIQGYSNLELYNLSQRIINDSPNSKIQSAYNISYTDIYDYSIKKQSLKKWEIELGIHHLELGLPWDKPVPKELWEKVAEYCCNDVEATEAVWDATQSDFVAREILADLTGGTCNMTTNTLITKLLFGDDKNPELVYTDLRTGEQY